MLVRAGRCRLHTTLTPCIVVNVRGDFRLRRSWRCRSRCSPWCGCIQYAHMCMLPYTCPQKLALEAAIKGEFVRPSERRRQLLESQGSGGYGNGDPSAAAPYRSGSMDGRPGGYGGGRGGGGYREGGGGGYRGGGGGYDRDGGYGGGGRGGGFGGELSYWLSRRAADQMGREVLIAGVCWMCSGNCAAAASRKSG